MADLKFPMNGGKADPLNAANSIDVIILCPALDANRKKDGQSICKSAKRRRNMQ
jgi:hypothetical protein